MYKWIKQWKVQGSGKEVYTVSVDKNGCYACSCPVWKFKRVECKHIDLIKSNPNHMSSNNTHRSAMPGNVGEVTIAGVNVLYPLVPFNPGIQTHLIATIIYDMQSANVDPNYIKDYKDRMFKEKVSFKAVDEYIRSKGRLVYSKWVEKQGWTGLETVPYDTPLKEDR